jgi:c-di-GMP-binding flagellar brake protein YcgR
MTTLLLYSQLVLLALLLLFEGYRINRDMNRSKMQRRRWARVKVPSEKMITCRLMEPKDVASDAEYVVNDINIGGMCFFSDKKIDKVLIKLVVRFPFTSYKDAGAVWGRVVYCNKMENMEKYRVGVAYTRKVKWSKV